MLLPPGAQPKPFGAANGLHTQAAQELQYANILWLFFSFSLCLIVVIQVLWAFPPRSYWWHELAKNHLSDNHITRIKSCYFGIFYISTWLHPSRSISERTATKLFVSIFNLADFQAASAPCF